MYSSAHVRDIDILRLMVQDVQKIGRKEPDIRRVAFEKEQEF